jgi:uncharacterized membrane protein (UPF0127 family)
MSARRAAAALAASLLAAACGGGDGRTVDSAPASALQYDTARVRITTPTDTIPLTVELARTDEQKQLGLMERRTLGERAGMLFVYDTEQSDSSGFWMYRTRIPLDIAFIDSTGTIRSIRTMQPCTSDLAGACPSYIAGARYRAALEVNAGFFERHRVQVGHLVVLGDTAR